MEAWQKNHIIKNLPALLENTQCSSLFLTTLQSKQVLSREDVEVVEAATGGNTSKVKALYNILQTRINAYGILKECLEETKQTGALAILNQISGKSLLKYYGSISYDRNKLIGRGCWGTKVFRGTHSVRDVAVKIIDCADTDVEQALREVNLLKDLQWHENIVQFYHAEVTDDAVYITLELCSISLHECIRHKLYPISRVKILRQATNGLLYLHNNSIVHRDLKPSNILVMKTRDSAVAKLSDFGMSKRLHDDRSSFTAVSAGFGTQGWMAPEVIKYLFGGSDESVDRMSYSTDIFPLGCIFYFTLTDGIHPFGDAVRCEGNILDDDPILDSSQLKEGDGDDCSMLIQAMILPDPKQRPTCSEVLSGIFFHSSSTKATITSSNIPQKDVPNMLVSGRKFQKALLESQTKYNIEMQRQLTDPKVAFEREILDSVHIAVCDMVIQDLDETFRENNQLIQNALDNSFRKYLERNEMNLNSEKEVAIGIDFGATYCRAAFYQKGDIHMICNSKGERTLACAISFHKKDKLCFGNDAKWAALESLQNTVFDLKRIVGQTVGDLKLQKQFWGWPFKLTDSSHDIQLEGNGWKHGVKELVAMLLGELRSWATTIIGVEVQKAVITVPSYFTETQKTAVRLSGELAGFRILDIVNEPLAIAMAYNFQNTVEVGKKLLIIDLGGATFKAAVVEKSAEGGDKILAEEYDPDLGGKAIDASLLDYCCQNIKDIYGLDLHGREHSTNTIMRDRTRLKLREILLHCEQTKILLSTKESAIVECGSFDHQGIFHTKIFLTTLFQNRYTTVTVSQQTFNELNDQLFQKALKIVNRVLERSGVSKEELHDIVLVGGSARIPRVQELLQHNFPDKIFNQNIQPDEAVAYGAALRAALLNTYNEIGK